MKKILYLLMLCVSTSFVGCSDDDDDDKGGSSKVKIENVTCNFDEFEGVYYVEDNTFGGISLAESKDGIGATLRVELRNINLNDGKISVYDSEAEQRIEKDLELNKEYSLSDITATISLMIDDELFGTENDTFGAAKTSKITFLDRNAEKNYIKFKLSNLTFESEGIEGGQVVTGKEKLSAEDLTIESKYEKE